MTLPILNSEPKYITHIPSTKQEIHFRPYLVKEEKVLLLAMESEDNKQILNAISDTIAACVEEEININVLTSFDIEFLFVKIRSKSVGESQLIGMACEKCNFQNEVRVNLEDLHLDISKADSLIELDDKTTLEMKWPSYKSLADSGISDMKSTDQLFAVIKNCLEAVQHNDARIEFKDYSDDEIYKFVDSLNSDQFSKLRVFIEGMPTLKHTVEFECTDCKEKNVHVLEGMQSFFA